MNRLVALLAVCVLALPMTVPPIAAADPSATCPDGFMAVFAPGDRHDKNGNGIVCRKIQDGRVSGGPDDSIDDVIV
jgi:hypothetical protein